MTHLITFSYPILLLVGTKLNDDFLCVQDKLQLEEEIKVTWLAFFVIWPYSKQVERIEFESHS